MQLRSKITAATLELTIIIFHMARFPLIFQADYIE